MDAHYLQAGIEQVRHGTLSRRGFLQRLAAAGIAAPIAGQLLAHAGIAWAAPASSYKPTKAGGGGTLKLLWWQGPTQLNPHFAVGLKDQDGARLFYEPLAMWDEDGNLIPVLAAELPSRANGGVAADSKSVTWKLKQGVTWHDGQTFTADDVVFNWEYAKEPATATVTTGSYNDVIVEKIDDHTVRVSCDKGMPFWADAFVGAFGMIIPKHIFAPFMGANSRAAPHNSMPIGTGPYMFKAFQPGDQVSGVRNPHYHVANQPFFDAVEMKGGGDAASAARAVLETGEYDFAGNLQVEDQLLLQLETAGKGVTRVVRNGSFEMIELNGTDPNVEVDGEHSSIKTVHPTLSDPAVRQALALLVDRESVHKYIYGRGGVATGNIIYNPPQFNSPNTHWEFNIDQASALLEAAGWTLNSDGVREKDGKQLKYLFQTSTNAPRQKTQQIVKQACKKAGIAMELKSVIPSVYFAADVGNPDTSAHFSADLQMSTTGPTRPDPGLWLQRFLSTQVAQKSNQFQGRNMTRWRNAAFDAVYAQSTVELDPVKRAALIIHMNDLVVNNVAVIPIVTRPAIAAMATALRGDLTSFGSCLGSIAGWYKDG